MTGAPPARYELVTRAGCHLCHEMAALLDEVLPAHGLTWQSVDVDANPTLRLRYGEAVPVLLRDGKPVAKVRVDRTTLERIARGRRWGRLGMLRISQREKRDAG